MKNLIIYLSLILILSPSVIGQNIPKSSDLIETDKYQRRDLSMPMSRIVLNFFDFKSLQSTYEFSTRNTIPLNIAFLSTDKNQPGTNAINRFSRSVTDLFTIHKTKIGIDSLITDSSLGGALKYRNEWMPHALSFSAEFENNGIITGTDFLYDLNTIVRKLYFNGDTNDFYFSGNWNGVIKFEKNTIIIENNNLCYAISFSSPVVNFNNNQKKWIVKLDNKKSIKDLIITVAFVDKFESQIDLVNRAQNPIRNNDIDIALNRNEKYWDDFLMKVPHPKNFELTSVKTFGITAEQIRQAYYKAWVFTAQNVLPPDNTKFPYPQICTGKASLWDEGEEHAPFSAAWESFIGIQLYAYIDPTLSWNAFKGLMSLVDENGMLGGESLPSRKAQTALILYKLTNDKKSLKEIYPALKRYLNWRLGITHWVYGDLKATNDYKDAEFAFSALSDIQYLLEISKILGQKQDMKEWNKKFEKFSNDCLKWFWETPESLPVQNYWIDQNKRSMGNTIWVTSALHVKNFLKGNYLSSTLKRFDNDYNPDLSFANFYMPKYPDMSYSIYGLVEHGFTDRALKTLEASLRDIARGHTAFAEQYVGSEFNPDGVRPSLFGSSIIIDFVLMKNGYMFGDGNPKSILLSNQSGGVTNILIDGKIHELEINANKKEVKFGEKDNLKTFKAKSHTINLK